VEQPDAVTRRLGIAERAAAAYIANPRVAAVLVAGSVARGLADEFSDIELDVYWAHPPTVEDRVTAVEGAGWDRVYAEVDEYEWADGYSIDGVRIDTSGFLTSTIDGYLDAALERADLEPELQVRITALLHGRPLHGQDVIGAWRSRCALYPTALAVAMVEDGLWLRPRERLEMLATRDDPLLLHRDLVDNVQGLLDALFGLNRVYKPHPFHKWLDWEATLLPLAPGDLASRIRRLLVASPHLAVRQMCALADETFDLVESELPTFDIAKVRVAFGVRRTGS
jgi:predicted nucleotidyltransferase